MKPELWKYGTEKDYLVLCVIHRRLMDQVTKNIPVAGRLISRRPIRHQFRLGAHHLLPLGIQNCVLKCSKVALFRSVEFSCGSLPQSALPNDPGLDTIL